MHDDKLDVLNVNVVFVVGGEKSIDQEKFGECVGAEVTIAQNIVLPASPTPVALAPTTVSSLTLDRERITVEPLLERLQVTKKYPSAPEELRRVGEVTSCAHGNAGLVAGSVAFVGYNMQFVYEIDQPVVAFLKERCLAPTWPKPLDWRFLGSTTCNAIFQDGEGRQWTILMEPRKRDIESSKLFCDVNLHFQKPHDFNQRLFVANLQHLWETSTSFVKELTTK